MLPQLKVLDNSTDPVKFCYDNDAYCYLREAAFKALPSRFQRYLNMPHGLTAYYGTTTHITGVPKTEGWIHRYIRDLYSHLFTQQIPRKMTYISRSKALCRRVVNEEALIESLRSRGISTYVLEDMTFEDCVRLFHDSDLIIGPHGAGLSFACFCKPGTILLEINDANGQQTHFSFLAAECDLKYMRFMEIEGVPNTQRDQDYYVDQKKFLEQIDEIIEFLQARS
jgi:capsular polysaccharide biosynthesis protein